MRYVKGTSQEEVHGIRSLEHGGATKGHVLLAACIEKHKCSANILASSFNHVAQKIYVLEHF